MKKISRKDHSCNIITSISSANKITEICKILKDYLEKHFDNLDSTILLQKENNLLENVCRNNLGIPIHSEIKHSKKGIIGWVAKMKKELVFYKTDNETRIFEGNSKYKSIVVLPLIKAKKMLGILVFAAKKHKRWSNKEMQDLRKLRDAVIISLSLRTLLEEKKKHSNAISNLNQYINSIINGLPSGIITIDKKGNITLINKKAQQILGFKEKDAKKMTIGKLFEYRKATTNPLMETLTEKKPLIRVEANILEESGKKTPIGFSTALLKDDSGKVIGVIGIMRELTEIKQVEERIRRQDRLLALGEMAAGMAHEIRNPLAGIKTGVEYLGRFLEGKKTDSVKLIVGEIDRLNRIVTDMTQYANRPPIRLDTVRLQDIIELSLSFLKNKIDGKGIKIVNRISKNIPRLKLDCDQIREVFDNILLNAIQATEKNDKIRLSTKFLKKAKMIEIIIEDTGSGISTKDKEKIFNPFFTTKRGGTGLGLSITHRIISEHKGYVSISGREGQGTTVKIGLPTEL